jgi:2-keto-3-deoxy-L-rhamnonate aldolase RhmA
MLRAHTGYEKILNAREYMDRQNADSILMAQIESQAGIDNIDEILAVPGIDVAFIGPNDLTQSLGISGQFDHPTYIAALDRIMAAASKSGKYSGIHLMSSGLLKPWIKKGMRCNVWSNDVTMLMDAARSGIAELRSQVQEK